MGLTNAELLRKIDTSSLAGGGLLNPEQAAKFIEMVFEATPFSRLHRKETVGRPTGEIDKIGVGRRLLRKKVEGVDTNEMAGINTGKIQYSCQGVRLAWDLTEETLRRNIEGEAFEDRVMKLMTRAVGVDMEDLHFNGDTATPSSDPDYLFLSINDGWIKLAKTQGGHVLDHTAIGTAFGRETLFAMVRALPNKYRSQELRWVMSPTRRLYWIEYLTQRTTAAGDAALLGAGDQVNRPLGYEIVEVPSFPDSKIMLVNPQNLVAVVSDEIRIRKTTEGKDAVLQDKRFYAIFLEDDAVIEEPDAVVLCENVPDTLAAA